MNSRTALCLLLLLSACSPDEHKAPAPKLMEAPRAVLEKAKTVDPIQKQHEEDQQKAINQQSQ